MPRKLLLAAFVLAGMAADCQAQGLFPRLPMPQIEAPPRDDPPADPAMKVRVDPAIGQPRLPTYQRVATFLDGLRIGPNDARVGYFAQHTDLTSPQVKGWSGTIMAIDRADVGFIVTIRVETVLDRATDNLSLIERYHVGGGQATMVDSFEPLAQRRIVVGY